MDAEIGLILASDIMRKSGKTDLYQIQRQSSIQFYRMETELYQCLETDTEQINFFRVKIDLKAKNRKNPGEFPVKKNCI